MSSRKKLDESPVPVQPIHRPDLPRLAAARSLREFSSIHDVAGVTVVFLQHRGAGAHNGRYRPERASDGDCQLD